jgi:N-methylhydantoinase A
LREGRVSPDALAGIAHGTTIATNAILEHRGAKTGLITTEGFRDVLELRRLRMPRLYDMGWVKPDPLVPREWRKGVPERCDARGNVLLNLDEEAVKGTVRDLLSLGVESIAVSLLHSYQFPWHERRVGEIAQSVARSMGVPLDISLSVDVLPQRMEYERTSTTVINAYVQPVVRRYLGSLSKRLTASAVTAPVMVMQSNGGLTSVDAAVRKPAGIIESGPAAGVVGAADWARLVRLDDMIVFDMGGTTAKASMVERGSPTIAAEYEVGSEVSLTSRLLRGGGYLLRMPAIDVAEVGAGGGSIVWVDSGGALRVGPQSAGAEPGPVSYCRGGSAPTLTDANAVLGYVCSLAGGEVVLDHEAASRALSDEVARPLGLSIEEAAYGARRVAVSTMVQLLRAISVERGRDPRKCSLFAFGGNGPLHAAELADAMGIRSVVIPPLPGVFSAVGLCLAPISQHFLRSHTLDLTAASGHPLMMAWNSLAEEASSAMEKESIGPNEYTLTHCVALKYSGQDDSLMIDDVDPIVTAEHVDSLVERFRAEHRRAYGYDAGSGGIEVVTVGVIATSRRLMLPELLASATRHAQRRRVVSRGERRAYVGGDHKRWQLLELHTEPTDFAEPQSGPRILELYDATVLVPEEWTVRLDDNGYIWLNR